MGNFSKKINTCAFCFFVSVFQVKKIFRPNFTKCLQEPLTIFSEKNQPLFKRADRRNLGVGSPPLKDGAVEIAIHCKKPKAVPLVKWFTKICVRVIQQEHQQAITDHGNQIQAIQCDIVALQPQREVYQAQLQRCQDHKHDLINCHEPRVRNLAKSNAIVRKHTTTENDKYHDLPYCVI